jgi:multicomponent K+:H+ antiporter subunit F
MTLPVLQWALPVALVVLVLAMGCTLLRVLKGPSAQDRVLALDCMTLNGMLLMLVLGLHYRSQNYFEAALLLALLSFVGTMAMAKFLLRGEVIE